MGHVKHPLYFRWRKMRQRCTWPEDAGYANYGGRGIKVCDRWQNFWLYVEDIDAIGPCPGPGYTLDRIDNDGDYLPGNMRWATHSEQNRNKREYRPYAPRTAPPSHQKTIVRDGDEILTITSAAHRLGLKYDTVKKRLKDLRRRDPTLKEVDLKNLRT